MFILVTLLVLAIHTRDIEKASHNKAKVLGIFFVQFFHFGVAYRVLLMV